MKKTLVFSISFFLLGCYRSPFLPNKLRDLSEFIPQDEKIIEKVINPSSFTFVKTHFPEDCEWKTFDRVIDGDTILVEGDVRVRFIGIDTPETKHPDKPIQKWGIASFDKTKELLKDAEKVCLIFDDIGDRYDTYNRLLAYPFTEEGEDVSEQLLSSGLARGYYFFPFEREDEFPFFEREAKEKQLGVWSKK